MLSLLCNYPYGFLLVVEFTKHFRAFKITFLKLKEKPVAS